MNFGFLTSRSRHFFTSISLIAISLTGQAQQWPVGLRASLYEFLKEGHRPRPLRGNPFTKYFPPVNGKGGQLQHSLFLPKGNVSKDSLAWIKERHLKMICSFVLGDSIHQYDYVNLVIFSGSDSIIPKRLWTEVLLDKYADSFPTVEDRLGVLTGILPFEVASSTNDTAIALIIKDQPFFSPPLENETEYFEVLATIIHYYVLRGNSRKIFISYEQHPNSKAYSFDEHTNFDKVVTPI